MKTIDALVWCFFENIHFFGHVQVFPELARTESSCLFSFCKLLGVHGRLRKKRTDIEFQYSKKRLRGETEKLLHKEKRR